MKRSLVLYDGDCPMCIVQMRLFQRLDWLGALEPLPLSDSRAAAAAPGVTPGELAGAIHCVSPRGKIYRGARCVRFLCLRIPLAVPLALFLWIPGVIFVAERVYARVSRHRLAVSRLFGCKDSCVPPPSRRK